MSTGVEARQLRQEERLGFSERITSCSQPESRGAGPAEYAGLGACRRIVQAELEHVLARRDGSGGGRAGARRSAGPGFGWSPASRSGGCESTSGIAESEIADERSVELANRDRSTGYDEPQSRTPRAPLESDRVSRAAPSERCVSGRCGSNPATVSARTRSPPSRIRRLGPRTVGPHAAAGSAQKPTSAGRRRTRPQIGTALIRLESMTRCSFAFPSPNFHVTIGALRGSHSGDLGHPLARRRHRSFAGRGKSWTEAAPGGVDVTLTTRRSKRRRSTSSGCPSSRRLLRLGGDETSAGSRPESSPAPAGRTCSRGSNHLDHGAAGCSSESGDQKPVHRALRHRRRARPRFRSAERAPRTRPRRS